MPMVGFLIRNDSDILRAKTGPYRHIGYQTNIPPTPESRPHSHPLSPLASSLMGPSPRKVILYVEPADLHPNGYLWFMRPDSKQLHSPSFHQNIPIPGQYYSDDFKQGVSLCGCTWNVGVDALCQWCYDYFIKLFVNLPDDFKFLVDIKYINKEYAKGVLQVHPNAVTLCQEWYGIKHVSAGQTRSLVDIDMLVLNPELANHAYMGGLCYLIMSLWQTPLFPKTHLQKEAEATSKKLGKVRLVPKAPLSWMFLSMSSSSYPTPPGAHSLLSSPPPPPPMGQMLYTDADKEMTDVLNLLFSSVPSSPLVPSTRASLCLILPPLQPTTSLSLLPLSSLLASGLSTYTVPPAMPPPPLLY